MLPHELKFFSLRTSWRSFPNEYDSLNSFLETRNSMEFFFGIPKKTRILFWNPPKFDGILFWKPEISWNFIMETQTFLNSFGKSTISFFGKSTNSMEFCFGKSTNSMEFCFGNLKFVGILFWKPETPWSFILETWNSLEIYSAERAKRA